MIAIFRVLVSLVLMGLILHSVDYRALLALHARFDPKLAVLAVVVLGAAPLTSVPRWKLILARLGRPLPASVLVRALYVGAMFSQVLPSSVGGDVWRVWHCRSRGVPVGTATYSVLIERFAGICATILFFALAFPALIVRIDNPQLALLLKLLLGGCIAGCVAAIGFAAAGTLLYRVRFLRPLAGLALALAQACKSPRVALAMAVTAITGQLVGFVAYFILAHSLGTPLSLIDCIETMPPVLLITLVPISFGGWGLREGAFVVLLKSYGIPGSEALLLSVSYGLAFLVSALPGLVFWLMPSRARTTGNPNLVPENSTDAA